MWISRLPDQGFIDALVQQAKPIKVRAAKPDDAAAMAAVAKAAYAAWPASTIANERNYSLQIAAFPTGQLVAVLDNQVIGYATSLIVQLDDDSPWHNHAEMTGYGTFSTHDPAGQTLYGADIAVHPDWQGKGVSGLLYQARRTLMKRHNLKQMVAGGRIPGYAAHRGQLTAQEYVDKVRAGELGDPALNAHLHAGYTVEGVHYGYLDDQESLGYATHLVMPNPDFHPRRRLIAGAPVRRTARHVRVCATQYDQRRISTFEDFADQIEYFAQSAATYDAHLLLFPDSSPPSCTPPSPAALHCSTRSNSSPHWLRASMRCSATWRCAIGCTWSAAPRRCAPTRACATSPTCTPRRRHLHPGETAHHPGRARVLGHHPGDGIKVFETASAG